MSRLPSRPNLDHLRRQAKALLGALAEGDREAIATLTDHLPEARGMSAARVRAAGFRLADAQAAIARKTGFASWPRLARHVEQLRALEGEWEFASLEMDGQPVPASMLSTSRLLIDGDRFRTESPGATYEGVFTIDVEADPHTIDIEFVAGPEAGNVNRGLYRLSGDELTFCLDTTGRGRPPAFRTSAGTGHALETLRRASAKRPVGVTGGTGTATAPLPVETGCSLGPTMTRLQGAWRAVRVVRDGTALPKAMLAGALRTTAGHEVRVTIGGRDLIHAAALVVEGPEPIAIDYRLLSGPMQGQTQLGIMRWVGADAEFCMAAPGGPRPTEFESASGSGRTLSRWSPPGA